MPDIVLTTLNAKYIHAAFGLRYLMANLSPGLRGRAVVREFDIAQRTGDVLEAILADEPRIVGVGVYIWNVEPATRLVADLKRLRPDVTIVVGGPEVSYEVERQEICGLADFVITGEADLAFAELCEKLLAGRRPLNRVIAAELPEFSPKSAIGNGQSPILNLPYSLYTDEDLARRVVYVEASRGCPFRCEFCLSSLDVPVRNVPLDAFLGEMQALLDRGLRTFKFVDRTFNLNLNIGRSILQFFHERWRPELFLHFEMIPDRLPEALREPIAKFPPGGLQFEVGIQTFNEDVSGRISRRQDNAKVEENLRFLREHTGVHVHADLIAGLPGEDLDSFAAGFDRLVSLRPQEIQVGILKRLRGTPIVRHDEEWGMVYSRHAPYEVLETRTMPFATMQRLRRFARYWDLIANSGNFVETTPLIWWADGRRRANVSVAFQGAFGSFMDLTDWLFERAGRTHAMSLQTLAEYLFRFLTDERGLDPKAVAEPLWRDYQRGGRSDRPAFLRDLVTPADTRVVRPKRSHASRQARHLS